MAPPKSCFDRKDPIDRVLAARIKKTPMQQACPVCGTPQNVRADDNTRLTFEQHTDPEFPDADCEGSCLSIDPTSLSKGS